MDESPRAFEARVSRFGLGPSAAFEMVGFRVAQSKVATPAPILRALARTLGPSWP